MPDEIEVQKFKIEGAQLIFRNFAGKESKFNTEGQRNFCVILDSVAAKKMAREGWNVKTLENRDDEGEPGTPYIKITVNFKYKPPRIVLLSSNSRTQLTEDTVSTLDWADIRNCDLIARAYEWNVGDKSGLKAYLQTMFVTIEEDELEQKYAEYMGE